MKFMHLADCHMDAPISDLGQTVAKAITRRQELQETFLKAVELAKFESVDLILIAGDLFEHKYVSDSTIAFINNIFKTISNIKVFISPGDSDPFVGNSPYNTFTWSENVHIFKGNFEKVFVANLNTNIFGVGFDDYYINKCKVKEIGNTSKENINILLTHGCVDLHGCEEKYHPLPLRYISNIGFDYCALGHIHKKSLYESNICYSGSLEPLEFDSFEEHGVIIGTIAEDYKKFQFFPISKRKYITLEIDITNLKTIQEIANKIIILSGETNINSNLFKIILIGQADDNLLLDIEQLKDILDDKFYFISIIDSSQVSYNIDEFLKEPTLIGVFTRKMLDLIDKSADSGKMKLTKALQYGLDALIKNQIKLK